MLEMTYANVAARFDRVFHANDWTNASTIQRETAYRNAVSLLNALFVWSDSAKTVSGETTLWDERILDAVAEQILFLLRYDPYENETLFAKRVVSASVAGCSVSFDRNGQYELISPAAVLRIGRLGRRIPSCDRVGEIESSMLG